MALSPLLIADPQPRPCGECKACCTALQVVEIDKPPDVPCHNLCEAGCGIYDNRPGSCRSYECLWQGGGLEGDRRRPDILGVIFDCGIDPAFKAIVARELRPDAFAEPAAAYTLEKMSKGILIQLLYYRSNRTALIGPEKLKRRMREMLGNGYEQREAGGG
jgi:hypothetical protein